MKRIVAVLLSTCLIASCNSPEDKAEDFYEDMMEALEEQDFDKVLNVFREYDDWYNTLSESEQQEFEEALEKNKHEADKIQDMLVECSPEWLNTGQFMKLIRHSAGEMKTEDYYDYHYGTWSYKDQEVSALCFEGKYYVCFDAWYDYFVMVPFEDAEKAMVWLEGVYSRLTDIRKKMDASGVSDIEKNITIEEPDMLYCLETFYGRTEVCRISDISYSEISIKRNRAFGTDHIRITFDEPRCSMTVSDESYHAIMAALKSRNEMKKQLDAYKELEDSIY